MFRVALVGSFLLSAAGCTSGESGTVVNATSNGHGDPTGTAGQSSATAGASASSDGAGKGASTSTPSGGGSSSGGSGGAAPGDGASPVGASPGGTAAGGATAGTPSFTIGTDLPWFSPTGGGITAAGGDAGPEATLLLTTTSDEPRDAVTTHLPQIDFTEQWEGLSFSARASVEQSLFVALTRADRAEYWADVEAGFAWDVAEVRVTTEWQDFVVLFDSMAPLVDGEPVPASRDGGSAIHFFMQNADGARVWLDDVVMLARAQ